MIKNIYRLLRPAHWIKNLLLFLPLIFARRAGLFSDDIQVLFAFVLFCMAASAGYLINDLADINRDKKHRVKKERPLASGKVPIYTAIIMTCALFALSLLGAYQINHSFFVVIAFYLALTAAYSLFLKKVVIVDVMVLAGFYILRILAGMTAINARISHWMIICVGLLALFLGFNKRRHEISFMGRDASSHRSVLAKYSMYFIDQMISIVTAATVLSYTLYVIDPETVTRFGTRGLILTVPFVYYGIFRYLYIVHKKRKGGDPVRIFLSDKMMIVNGCLWILTAITVIYAGIEL